MIQDGKNSLDQQATTSARPPKRCRSSTMGVTFHWRKFPLWTRMYAIGVCSHIRNNWRCLKMYISNFDYSRRNGSPFIFNRMGDFRCIHMHCFYGSANLASSERKTTSAWMRSLCDLVTRDTRWNAFRRAMYGQLNHSFDSWIWTPETPETCNQADVIPGYWFSGLYDGAWWVWSTFGNSTTENGFAFSW